MLRDDINNALKDAMKAKDERKISTLRLMNSTITVSYTHLTLPTILRV